MLRFAVVAVAVAGVAAPSAQAVPAVVAGWPVPGLAGPVLPGPGGGVVIVDEGVEEVYVAALRPDGRILWRSREDLGCGNCDFGPQPVRLQPDGTYGPLGAEGDSFWAVDRTGVRVTGCTGAVLADGTCVSGGLRSGGGGLAVDVSAVRGGAVRWTFTEPDFASVAEGDLAPPVVADGAGTAYAALGRGWVVSTATEVAGRLIALDIATGALRWRLDGPFRVLTGLPAGVLVADGARVSAVDGAVVRWSLPEGARARQGDTIADPARGRVYLGLAADRVTPAEVVAVDIASGAELWRTAAPDRARLLSVGPTGRVYVATERDGRPALRAIDPSGRGRWSSPVPNPVTGAAELARGRVALTVSRPPLGSFLVGATTLLIDPARSAPVPRRRSFALTPDRVRACPDPLVAGRCTTLRMTLTRPTGLRLRLRTPRGRLADFDARIPAPRGTSWVRLLFGRPALAAGRHVLEVRAGGRVISRRPFVGR
jgi:outer membrane protein assembly factor BamB